ncbi:diguanylate cyclase regulator RdcB family protein [Escherichia coli]|uniref:diguanylate cyclase regulator RdcB family protein n=1 Tax=Escherichia coli TaxID=562 RepID=UPI002FCD685D
MLGRITPGRCLGAVLSFSKSCVGGIGDACRLGSPQAVALLLGDLRVKATTTSGREYQCGPTTRHYYHQWFASSTVPTGGIMLIFKLAGKVDHGR